MVQKEYFASLTRGKGGGSLTAGSLNGGSFGAGSLGGGGEGRTLLRINDNSLLRLGITNDVHREAIWRQILKLRLKTDIMEIRDMQRRNTNNMFYDYSIA
ncbi:unnamed protein product [Callosobruchus maculatus]|uniref:Uncharacterized protein n=1 Tax=Callosobruchus maculatus TaxID=64391 RepID=A0A653DBZ0_CALMS|nr:unnamed protein product [Callosobruchus maculatus]